MGYQRKNLHDVVRRYHGVATLKNINRSRGHTRWSLREGPGKLSPRIKTVFVTTEWSRKHINIQSVKSAPWKIFGMGSKGCYLRKRYISNQKENGGSPIFLMTTRYAINTSRGYWSIQPMISLASGILISTFRSSHRCAQRHVAVVGRASRPSPA